MRNISLSGLLFELLFPISSLFMNLFLKKCYRQLFEACVQTCALFPDCECAFLPSESLSRSRDQLLQLLSEEPFSSPEETQLEVESKSQ